MASEKLEAKRRKRCHRWDLEESLSTAVTSMSRWRWSVNGVDGDIDGVREEEKVDAAICGGINLLLAERMFDPKRGR